MCICVRSLHFNSPGLTFYGPGRHTLYNILLENAIEDQEYPAVVIPLLNGPKMLMNRNLLYTAVTRARKCVTLVGDETVFEQMEHNVTEQVRYSGLIDRIWEQGA